ncbi:hypothetical protein [Actinomycetospora corticicola]|uniref:Uncharacterized protein n=1 Tax=Actinomycetospora corticicola TaxID=663602 RepID=A0A7Y9DZ72_9PSEU|nr:hypothetical protein [Actinomycetospora corticicola]NYD38071.1 hypothetical protein [Actinomycetospora corticicola]
MFVVRVVGVAWVYTVLLAATSAGILSYALVLTRRLFRDEAPRDLSGGAS